MWKYRVKQDFNSSKVRQCFNQKNSSHEICCCESFTESKFDAKFFNAVKLTTY